MQVDRVIAQGQLVKFVFAQADVAASQTDVQLKCIEVDNVADDALNVDEYVSPWAGDIIGISYSLSAAGSAGSLAIGATVNGTEDADTTQTVTTAQRGSATLGRGKASFAAGDRIGAEITTDGAWNGTASDLLVTVWAIVYIDADAG